MSTHFKHDVPSPSSLASTKLQLSGPYLVSPIPTPRPPPPKKKVLHFVIGYDKV